MNQIHKNQWTRRKKRYMTQKTNTMNSRNLSKDKNMERIDDKIIIDGIKHKAQERFAITVSSFGNSSDVGFVGVPVTLTAYV